MTQNTFDATAKIGADYLEHYDAVKMEVGEDYLEHYGVKGMKWGVRRNLKKARTEKARNEYLTKKDSKWLEKTKNPKKASRVARRAAKSANRLTKDLNRKYKKAGYKLKGNPLKKSNINNKRNAMVKMQYDTELKGILESSLDTAAYKVYKNSPSRLYQVNLKRNKDGTLKAEVAPRKNPKIDKQMAKITNYHANQDKWDKNKAKRAAAKASNVKHSASTDDEDYMDDLIGLEFDLTVDDDGFVTNVEIPNLGDAELEHSAAVKMEVGEDFLAHYGVKGMKWGVRKDGKPQGYQGGSGSSKRSITDVFDSEKRAKRRLAKAKKKFRTNQAKAQASALEKASKSVLPKPPSTKAETTNKSPKVSSVSDDELRAAVARLELEKRYNTLMAERQPVTTKKKVGKVVSKAANEAASEVLKSGMKYAMTIAVQNATGAKIEKKGKK